MFNKRKFFFAPNGEAGEVQASVIDQTFGPLSGIRPDLAANEDKSKADGPQKAIRAQEVGRPVLDSERAPEKAIDTTDEKSTTEAALDKPPAEVDEASGSDEQSPEGEQAVLDALIAKYQGKPKSLAKALREMRSLQTKTAEERKALEAQMEAISEVIDRDYETVDGKLVLRAEAAGRALRGGQGRAKPFAPPTEAEIRAQVEGEFRAQAADLFDEDQIPAYLQKMKPMIDSLAAERGAMAKAKAEAFRYNMLAEVGNIVESHLRDYPDDKKIMPEIDAIYGGIPEELRHAALLDEWLPFKKVAELVRVKNSVPTLVKEAYELGKKHRGAAEKVTDAGAPGKSRPAPQRGAGSGSDVVSGISKQRVVEGSGLPSIDTLFGR